MKVLVFNKQSDLTIRVASVRPIVKEVLKNEHLLTDEVAIYFVSSEEISQLHQEFFNDPSPTDCISFPLDGKQEKNAGYHVLGEVFVCPKTAIDYLGTSDAHSETTLYLVHGLLHLVGYKDIEEEDLKTIRKAEERHMQALANKNLLLKS